MSQQADVEDRLAALENLIGLVLAKARAHPVGRKVLAALGLE
jgi:hypothetical protein